MRVSALPVCSRALGLPGHGCEGVFLQAPLWLVWARAAAAGVAAAGGLSLARVAAVAAVKTSHDQTDMTAAQPPTKTAWVVRSEAAPFMRGRMVTRAVMAAIAPGRLPATM